MNRLLLVVLGLVTLSSVQLGQSQCDVTRITAAVYEVLIPILSEMKEDIRSVKSDIVNEMATINQRVSNYTEEVDARLNSLNESIRDDFSGVKGELKSMRDDFNGVERESSDVNNTANMICDKIEAHNDRITTELMRMEQTLTREVIYNTEKCGGTWGWRRAVYLDMTDPNTNCPSGWQLTGYSKRTCGRVSPGSRTCDSVFFPVSGGRYSQVCGRIRAYQHGLTSAFLGYSSRSQGQTTIDSAYVCGVAIMHGSPRQHIWTFAAGGRENISQTSNNCPCDPPPPGQRVPSFIGEDYFCESGHLYTGLNDYNRLHSSDILWDGKDCHSTSTCCSLHNPPYFTKNLSQTTTDDLELRICSLYERSVFNENIAVELVELYVK